MSGGTAGPIEVYHALRLIQGAEPLRPPLACIVGGLVTDFDSHRFVCVLRVSYRQPRSVAVADVPVAGLDLRGREGEGATLSERLTVGSRLCLHFIVAVGVVCHHASDQFFVSHLGLFHALSIGHQGGSGRFGGQFGKWHNLVVGGCLVPYTKVTSEGGAG